ncbi:MAG: FRG domain-containing protein [Actinobacteria bacterium]|nr:FRG domain-containing protein [Actinomycetota bacterium]
MTGQHYGLPTHLLDLTVDPLTAVWSPATPRESVTKRPSGGSS